MKSSLELAIAPQFYKDHLVQEQTHQVEGLGDVCRFLSGVRHGRRWTVECKGKEMTVGL